MIHLIKKYKIILMLVVLLLGLLLQGIFVTAPPVKKAWRYTPSHILAQEQPFDQPPAMVLDAADRVHLLSYDGGESLKVSIFTSVGQLIESHAIKLVEGKVAYYGPVVGEKDQPDFLLVMNRDDIFYPYLLTGHDWQLQELPFQLATPKDIGGAKVGQKYYFTYVERHGTRQDLYLQKLEGAEWAERITVVEDSAFITLPRMGVDVRGDVHLTWKGLHENLESQLHNRFDVTLERFTLNEPQKLGKASRYFGDEKQSLFSEDIGASLLPMPDGGMYISWTMAYWITTFNKLHSHFTVVKISPDDALVESRQWTGRNDFALFADMTYDHTGNLVVFYEDFYGRAFHLMSSTYPEIETKDMQSEELVQSFGSNRMAQVELDSAGNIVLVWKHLTGKTDTVQLRNEFELAGPKWYDRWSMWFVRDGAPGILRDGFFSLIYALVGAVAAVGSNALVIALFAIILAILQSRRVLGRCNFLMTMSVVSVLLIGLKFYGGFLYTTPVSQGGFMLFSALLATILTILAGERNWRRGGEEILYLGQIMLWLFADAFISFMYVAPGILAP